MPKSCRNHFMARSPYPAPVVIQLASQKQALHGEISEPERIRHPVRHKFHQLCLRRKRPNPMLGLGCA
jgi:hypothetical protein